MSKLDIRLQPSFYFTPLNYDLSSIVEKVKRDFKVACKTYKSINIHADFVTRQVFIEVVQ